MRYSSHPCSVEEYVVELVEVATGLRSPAHGTDIAISKNPFANLGLRHLEPVESDFLRILAAVSFVDRLFKRHQGRSRFFRLTLPLDRPQPWSEQMALAELTGLLQQLTGDSWHFEFHASLESPPTTSYLPFEAQDNGLQRVIPFSEGLDSFTLDRFEKASTNSRRLLVTLHLGSQIRGRVCRILRRDATVQRVSVPIHIASGPHPETSGRHRALLILGTSLLAARIAGVDVVHVPESGQGILGPRLVPDTHESDYVGLHPEFTTRLTKFLATVWGECPAIEQPFLFTTKASNFARLVAMGGHEGWGETRSCARDPGRRRGLKGRPQCGVCSNCLLRRMTVEQVLGHDAEDPTNYLWSLDGSTLESSVTTPTFTSSGDRDVAFAAVSVMNAFSNLARGGDRRLEVEAARLATAMGCDRRETMAQLRSLVSQHQQEWESFLARRSPGSWLVDARRDHRAA